MDKKELLKELIGKSVKKEAIDYIVSLDNDLSNLLSYWKDIKIVRENKNVYSFNKKSQEKLFDPLRDFVRNWIIPNWRLKNPDRRASENEIYRRLSKWFDNNPGVSIDVVRYLMQLYLSNVDAKYLSSPHYFIYKKKDGVMTSKLSEMLSKYKYNKTYKTFE